MIEILVAGFIIGLTHAIPPGPITFEVLRRGITKGFMPALQIDIGAVAADTVFFLVIAFGLAQIINDPTVKYAAIGYISASGRRLFQERHIRAMSMACSLIMLAFAVILFYRGYATLL